MLTFNHQGEAMISDREKLNIGIAKTKSLMFVIG
jgi:hypothetical protein